LQDNDYLKIGQGFQSSQDQSKVQVSTRQDNATPHDTTRQRQDKGKDKTRQGKARQDKTRQDKTGQDKTKDKTKRQRQKTRPPPL
jgi:hypothetical protein